MKLNDTIEYYIRTTSLALSRMYNAIAAEYGITQTIGYLLIYVEKKGTPASRLAQLMGMKNSSLTRLLQKMESEGCIERRVDADDKRVVRIFLTDKGVERRRIAKRTVLEFNEKLKKKIDQKDLEVFFSVFEVIKEQVDIELADRIAKNS